MDLAKIVKDAWPYLPAFRAVAETEHLAQAAARLHVVPSAVSRSIRLLEEAVGELLFARVGRRIRLNARGRALLEAVRQGTAAIERGAARAVGRALEGEYRVGTLGVLTNHVVLPALLELEAAHPGLLPVLRTHRASEANHRLALGELDAAFYYDAIPFDGVTCLRLGSLTNGVYCGRGHPLYRARRVDRRSLLQHPFSVPAVGDRNTSMDGWPVELERRVGMRVELLTTNLEVCRSGRFLTVLPDVVVQEPLLRGQLRRLDGRLVPPVEIYGAWRRGDEREPIGAALLTAIERRLRAIGRRRSSP